MASLESLVYAFLSKHLKVCSAARFGRIQASWVRLPDSGSKGEAVGV